MNTQEWFCTKCKTWNGDRKDKCSWCGTKNESVTPTGPAPADIKLTQDLHKAIDKLNIKAKRKLWAWLEDNVL